MHAAATIEDFIANWRDTGGSELANTQSFIFGWYFYSGYQ
jgi:hypothetical protein